MTAKPCGFPYALRRLCHAFPTPCPARAMLARILLGPRPSLHHLRCRFDPVLFGDFTATTTRSDFLMPVHHRLRLLAFPMRASRLFSLWPGLRPLRFRCIPFRRDVAFDPGGATVSRMTMPHMLPSTIMNVSASAILWFSWLNPTPHQIAVYASHPPSPATAQHSLSGSALPAHYPALISIMGAHTTL
jgi:hypothetical protein